MGGSSPRLSPGTLIDGKWRVGAPIGEGGMATVYEATHARNGRVVAVKVLHADIAKDPTTGQRFVREGYAANRVGHPGAVAVLDDGVMGGTPYLVMERLDGQSLDALARAHGGKLPVASVVRHGLEWLEVMAAAHEAGIVHRDLKPENVMVLAGDRVKVLDFGLARVRETATQARLTIADAPMGTPAFMPPEQAIGDWAHVDARSDVYAIGASLFTLLTGLLVNEARTSARLAGPLSIARAPPIRRLEPSVPRDVAAVIDRALSFDRAERHVDARAMLSELRRAAERSRLLERSARGPLASMSGPEEATRVLAAASPRRPPRAAPSDRARKLAASSLAPLTLALLASVALGVLGYLLASR